MRYGSKGIDNMQMSKGGHNGTYIAKISTVKSSVWGWNEYYFHNTIIIPK